MSDLPWWVTISVLAWGLGSAVTAIVAVFKLFSGI
jgi:hypothetical protein